MKIIINVSKSILLFCSLVLFTNCSTVPSIEYLPLLPNFKPISTIHIPYPIVLIHGLGQKSTVWDSYAVKYYEKELGLQFGGVLKKVNGKCILDNSITSKDGNSYADFFTVSFNNPVDSVEAWRLELEQYIGLVLKRTNAEKVILIGYSMGGLASRSYLTHHLTDHKVQRLITIGTPHQGSAFAKAYNWKSAITSALKANPNFASKFLLEESLGVLKAAETDVPFDAPAVRDLRRPEDGGTYLNKLGYSPHPLDVEYVSVVGDVQLLKETKEFNKTAVQELLRRMLGVLGFGTESLFESGDGVVSVRSQTMKEIPWFVQDKSRQRISQTITLHSVHEEHLKNSTEIQRISLEDQPEYKGAEFYRTNGNRPVLVVEFSDYLPPNHCTIELTAQDFTGKQFKFTPSELGLVQKSNGAILAQAVCYFPADIDWYHNVDFSITVKNSFGNKFTADKQWTVRR
ncbi:MAG: alpha/beta fold hydrolase [Bacteroidetes bacterium]|nr:alpha/beta fold hydrolase [Bacteroidota bacterium]